MTPEEIEALAARIASILTAQGWVPAPVRPDPPGSPTPGQLPPWAAAAQSLSDVAPGPSRSGGNRHRPSYATLSVAARAAAAGTGPTPTTSRGSRPDGKPVGPVVPVAVSNRHIHLSRSAVESLFGAGHRLTSDRPIRQPGQFAAVERVKVVGPGGAIDGVRIVGPARADTQVELALSDCRRLGVTAPIRDSGGTDHSAPIRLEGPAGSLDLAQGAIVAARHLHLSPADATRLNLKMGDRVDLRINSDTRPVTLHRVLVRSGETHATELHIDVDEARAVDLPTDATATIIRRGQGSGTAPRATRRRLVTDADVATLAAAGQTLSSASNYIITPAARDRAKALGIWRDD